MWNLFTYRVFTAERQREALRDAAQFRLARAAKEGRRVIDARSGSPDAGLGEAAPWWTVLRALRRRVRLPFASSPAPERLGAAARYGRRHRTIAAPGGNPDGCADQA